MERKSNKQPKLHIRQGDTVKVLSGNDRGKQGRVLQVFPKTRKAIVEGINLKTKHQKPSAENPEGGINKQEAPLYVSKLMLVDPATGEATRTSRKRDEDGKLQRYSIKTGEVIKNG